MQEGGLNTNICTSETYSHENASKQLLKMSTIALATFYNPIQWHYHEVAFAIIASLFLFLFRTYVSVSTNGKEKKKKSLPKSPMGIIDTIQMMAGRKVPMQLFSIAKDLDSWNFELNLPVPGHPKVVVVADAKMPELFSKTISQRNQSRFMHNWWKCLQRKVPPCLQCKRV